MAKIDDWLTDDKLTLIIGWARDGLTNEQIANNIGINTKTLYDWKKKQSKICNALKEAREVVDYQVENALLLNALSGNVTAQIFWLKNRKADKWRERQDYNNNEELNKLDKLLEEQHNAYMDN